VPYGDVVALQEALRAVLEDEGLRGRLREGARRLVREEFDWSKVVDRVEGIYVGAVEAGRLSS
jgi:glycosyltransferase involved in cell wall biosynthesis